jgi:hypothetical protein
MNFVANSSVSVFFFYTHICFVLIFVNCEGCGSEVGWNNKKQLLKPGGELNAMLVLLSFFYLVEACATILSCSKLGFDDAALSWIL